MSKIGNPVELNKSVELSIFAYMFSVVDDKISLVDYKMTFD